MNVAYAVAGALALAGAGIHGIAGEMLVVTKLRPDGLAATRLGGPASTKVMIRATWHIVTIAFALSGIALVACGAAGGGAACRATGSIFAIAYACFAALVIGLGAIAHRRPSALLRHPAPALFTLVALLCWRGATL